LIAESTEEVRGEVLAEHELDERSHEVRRIEVAAIGALRICRSSIVGDPRLVPDRVEVHAKRVEVLEALVHLEREHDARVDVVPGEANEPRQVDG
jgi:hypothetical protein